MFAGPYSEILDYLVWIFISILLYAYFRNKASDIQDKYHTFGRRVIAYIIDLTLLGEFITACHFCINYFETPDMIESIFDSVTDRYRYHIYPILFHWIFGQTIGKMVCGIKVVKITTEGRLSFVQALVRSIVFVAPLYAFTAILYKPIFALTEQTTDPMIIMGYFLIVPLLFLGTLSISMFTNDKRRAIHDIIAYTVVIRTNIKDETGEEKKEEV
jgi:uncharacterized RDD family membrane protein YckC